MKLISILLILLVSFSSSLKFTKGKCKKYSTVDISNANWRIIFDPPVKKSFPQPGNNIILYNIAERKRADIKLNEIKSFEFQKPPSSDKEDVSLTTVGGDTYDMGFSVKKEAGLGFSESDVLDEIMDANRLLILERYLLWVTLNKNDRETKLNTFINSYCLTEGKCEYFQSLLYKNIDYIKLPIKPESVLNELNFYKGMILQKNDMITLRYPNLTCEYDNSVGIYEVR
jgi:hypothetical protein